MAQDGLLKSLENADVGEKVALEALIAAYYEENF